MLESADPCRCLAKAIILLRTSVLLASGPSSARASARNAARFAARYARSLARFCGVSPMMAGRFGGACTRIRAKNG